MEASPDLAFMERALALAREAASEGEIPVGAVVVKDGVIIGEGRNCAVAGSDPTGHAEIVALRSAAQQTGNYRLEGCTLYVTLEPCAMCAGAVLHARLARLVFGAADPKTGAAGSVVDLFSIQKLNHQTAVTAGVLEGECGAILSTFFSDLRQIRSSEKSHLREDALRTPESRFAGLPDFPWQAHYRTDLAGIQGLRLHYLDEGPHNAPLTMLCLHGIQGWSYAFRNFVAAISAQRCRVVAPDLIGCGKSDKPKRESFHTHAVHRAYLLHLIEELDLRNVVLVVHGWGGALGLTLPQHAPHRYRGLVAINSGLPWPRGRRVKQTEVRPMDGAQSAASSAPLPDAGHRALERGMTGNSAGSALADAEVASESRTYMTHHWHAPALLVEDAGDLAHLVGGMAELEQMLGSYGTKWAIDPRGGSWQEQGAAVAGAALDLLQPG
jgi:tRNA(adenine34) deaminase